MKVCISFVYRYVPNKVTWPFLMVCFSFEYSLKLYNVRKCDHYCSVIIRVLLLALDLRHNTSIQNNDTCLYLNEARLLRWPKEVPLTGTTKPLLATVVIVNGVGSCLLEVVMMHTFTHDMFLLGVRVHS